MSSPALFCGGTPTAFWQREFFLRWCLLFALFVLFLPVPTWAEEGAFVQRVLSGDSLVLKDGRTVRLAGIKVPAKTQEAARRFLETKVENKPVLLEKTTEDRYGRLAAAVFTTDGVHNTDLQETLLSEGLAFLYPPTGDEPNLDFLLKKESQARQENRGLWTDPAYADIMAEEASKALGHFAFVRGKILAASRVKNKVYLNFGSDWHTSFTLEIAAHDLRAFKKAGIDPLELAGKTVRVRGGVQSRPGPVIFLTNPAPLEILP